MEIQVQELIDKIKKDGISVALEEAYKIRAEADAEARRIVESAKKEAEDIINRGKQDAERSEKAGIAAMEQASRNLVLVFKDEVQALLSKVMTEYVSGAYNEDVLKAVLPELIKKWAEKNGDNLSVILPENELSKLKGFFADKLAAEFKKGVELKSSRKLSSGFHISNREGSAYYDFSATAVVDMLSSYLSPKLAEVMKNSTKGS
jgi:V/A-type H+-transporting ATPase subunit E